MSLTEIIDVVRSARESGTPVGVILGAHGRTQSGITWSHVCVAELMRAGWFEQAVDLHPKTPLVAACALIDLFPPLRDVPTAISGPAIYTLSPDQLSRFEGKGAWIAAGMNGNEAALPGAGFYWVRQFDQPVNANVHVIDGFDAESFFACLLESLDEFPPRALLATPTKPQRVVNGKQTPTQQLYSMLHAYSTQASKKVDGLFRELTDAYAQARPISDVFAWAERIERTAELRTRLGGAREGSSQAPLLDGLADNQTPRIADGLLERAERLHRTGMDSERVGTGTTFGIATTIWKRAKLRSGEAADKLYAESDRIMAGAKSGTPDGEVLQRNRWAEMLADWSQRHSGDQAARLFDTAIEKLDAALAIKSQYHGRVRALYIQLVERRARKLGTSMPKRYFNAARRHCQLLIESKESWRGYFGLGMIAVHETHTEPAETFRKAIELAPEQKLAILSDWGTALMESGQLAEAYTKFAEAAALDETAFLPQVNMSGVRLRQARRGEPTLNDAIHHAEQAESLKTGAGAYHLACAAAQNGHRADIEKWLTISGENGYLNDRQPVGMDTDFQSVASEPWFTELIERLYPADRRIGAP